MSDKPSTERKSSDPITWGDIDELTAAIERKLAAKAVAELRAKRAARSVAPGTPPPEENDPGADG